MSDIVERLKRGESCLKGGGQTCIKMNAVYGCLCAIAADEITRLTADIINYKIGNRDLQDHCTEITSLIAEADQNAIDLEEYRRDVEKLRAALEAICMMDISWVGDAFKLKDIARAALEET